MSIERITFTVGPDGTFWRTLKDGYVQGFYDDAGQPFQLPEPCSYFVSDPNPPPPAWFNPDQVQ